jgi:hypothetical protein
VGKTVLADGAGEGLGDVGLPEDVVEGRGTPPSIQGEVAHGNTLRLETDPRGRRFGFAENVMRRGVFL